MCALRSMCYLNAHPVSRKLHGSGDEYVDGLHYFVLTSSKIRGFPSMSTM
jgi:hypothetical protein